MTGTIRATRPPPRRRRSPWSVRFQKQNFNLGSDAQIDGQKTRVQSFFRDALKTALAAEKKFTRKRKAMLDKSEFQSGGSFDAVAWQKFGWTNMQNTSTS